MSCRMPGSRAEPQFTRPPAPVFARPSSPRPTASSFGNRTVTSPPRTAYPTVRPSSSSISSRPIGTPLRSYSTSPAFSRSAAPTVTVADRVVPGQRDEFRGSPVSVSSARPSMRLPPIVNRTLFGSSYNDYYELRDSATEARSQVYLYTGDHTSPEYTTRLRIAVLREGMVNRIRTSMAITICLRTALVAGFALTLIGALFAASPGVLLFGITLGVAAVIAMICKARFDRTQEYNARDAKVVDESLVSLTSKA